MTTTAVCSLLFGILIFGSIAYGSVSQKRKKREQFVGQVSGYLSGLASSGVLGAGGEHTARQVASLASEELARLGKYKKAIPEKADDPFYYAQNDCAVFSLLCIEKYARKCMDGAERSTLLDYCKSHYDDARRLHSRCCGEW